MLASLLTFFFVGLIVLVVASVALALVGILFSITLGLAGFLLFKVAPIMLVGYLILRFLAPRGPRRLTAEERKWLEE